MEHITVTTPTPMISNSLTADLWDRELLRQARDLPPFFEVFGKGPYKPPTLPQRVRARYEEIERRVHDAYRVLVHGDWVTDGEE